jgi:regulator of sigma E protease
LILGSVFGTIADVWGTVWPYLAAVLLFLFMIVIHELGHFVAAKLLGVRVNEFAVGFGPAIFKKQGKETLYSLRAVPFGGFCAMEGEDEGSSDPKAFCNKSAWRRLIIIVAGAFCNLVFGLVIVMFILAPADRFITTTVDGFHENSVSAETLAVGDEILKINGRRIFSVNDLSYCLSNVEGDTLNMRVKRNGEKHDLNVKFNTETVEDINYVKVDFYLETENKTFFTFIGQAFTRTFSYARVVWFSLIDLITGKFGISQMSGPVGITAVVGQAAKTGLSDLLPIIALITVNLGVFNLLPVPALDGGRAFFILVEMIIRRKIPAKFEAVVHGVGLVLLLGLIAVITIKDIVGFF